MRDIEQQRLALECLKLSVSHDVDPSKVVQCAGKFYAFVTGSDADDAKRKLTVVHNFIIGEAV